ncbi:PAS domain S-box protein [bacterium]|nr:PAS domain S-box protein [bacterium]
MARDKKDSKHSDEEILDLIDAFKYFDKTTTALNQAYRKLERKIEELRSELEEKNRLLSGSVAETTRIKNFLAQILDNMSSGLIVIDNQGVITFFNKTAEAITGIPVEEAVGRNFDDLFGEPKDLSHSLSALLRTEKAQYKKEKNIITRGGSAKPVEFSNMVVLDEKEEVMGAAEIFEDLTEIRSLQEEVRRRQTLVELGEMAANIAHEIRNPLGGIGGFATLLERDLEDDPEKQKLVKRILEGINSLNKITSDVLMYTRKIEPEIRPVNIKDLIEETLSLVRIEAENKNIQFSFKHPKESIDVEQDRNLFKQMLLNLLKNSINASKKDSSIVIVLKWKLLDNLMELSVKDNGCGIEPDVVDKIFNPFFTTSSKGTGLGLAIVRQVVEVHKGSITVDSVPGKGAEFKITLPILQDGAIS